MPEPVLSRQNAVVTALTEFVFLLQFVFFLAPAKQLSAFMITQASQAKTFLPWHNVAIAKATCKVISPGC